MRGYPLTSMQRAMVLASQRAPHSGVYVLQRICECREALDLELLKRAWMRVARRHAALRLVIERDGEGGYWQHAVDDPAIEWREVDWTSLDAARRQEELAAFLRADSERGFRWEDGLPPVRFALARTAEGSVLIWTIHHALVDGRSILIVWRELFAIYRGLVRGEEIRLPEAADFRAHLEWLGQQDFAQAEPYWRRQWEGIDETTGYVADRTRIAEITGAASFGKEVRRSSEELTRELEQFAGQEGITVNTLVLGAWGLLLSRYSGRPDVVFGVTRSGRHSSVPGAQEMVGLFINTLPFRVSTGRDENVAPWLRRLRSQWVEMRAYEQTPSEVVREWGSLVVYEHEPAAEALRDITGCTFSGAEKTDLPLTLAAYGKPVLTLRVIYDQRLYSQLFVTAMLGHLETLLRGFAKHRHERLGALSLLTPAEERMVSEEWNQTAVPRPRGLCAHHLFEQQARRLPDKAALEHPGGVVSYQELNRRANQLARWLRERGVGVDDLVAICLDRSPEAVVAVLAALKCGAAFLPLDPALPQERLAGMIEDAAPKIILRGDERADAQSGDDLPPLATPDNAAYAIFTSGSTGRPKAVLVTHRSLVNCVLALTQAQGITEADRRLQFGSIGSDLFVAEVFNYLTCGATLVFPGKRVFGSIMEFLRLLDEERITITGLASSWWHEWAAAMGKGAAALPRSLRAVTAGMERVNPGAFASWKRHVGNRVRWFNAYGPTETAMVALIYEAGSSKWEDDGFVPIGKPIANMRAYVLDDEMRPAPAGVAGELYLAGAGVARGYVRTPELTAQKFLPDPFGQEGRIYRTGDLAFALPDGNFVFLGRVDRQVKIRGHRVELEEIESVLAQHRQVRACAVIVADDQNLRAYLTTADGGEAPGAEELQRHLSARLPPHMIPRDFRVLERMPLTPSGKIDHRSLPADAERLGPADRRREPSTETERRLVPLWAQALGVASPGVADDFFESGGDSLRATILLTHIQEEFGQELSLTTLLSAPTISMLAWVLDAGGAARSDAVAALQPAGTRRPFFAVSPGPDDSICFRQLARHLGEDQPFYALNNPMTGRLQTVEELAGQICEAIRGIQPRGPYALGGYCFGGVVAFEAARQLALSGETVELLALFDTAAPGYPKILRARSRYWDELRRMVGFGDGNAERVGLREIIAHAVFVARLIPPKLRNRAQRLLLRTGLAPRDEVNPDLADLTGRSARTYVPKPVDFPVAQFIAEPERTKSRVLEETRLGWRDVSRGEFHVCHIGGGHASFLEQHAAEIAAALRELLAINGQAKACATAG